MSAAQASFTNVSKSVQSTVTTLVVRGMQGHGDLHLVLEAPIDVQSVLVPQDTVNVYCMRCGIEHAVIQETFDKKIPSCTACGALLGFTQASTSELFRNWLLRFDDPRKVTVRRVTRFNPLHAVFVVPVNPITGQQPRPMFSIPEQDVTVLTTNKRDKNEFRRPTNRMGISTQ